MVYVGCMVARIINKTADKILIIGPIYDKIEKLNKIKELSQNYDYIIFNGSLCYPYDDLELVKTRIAKFNEQFNTYKSIYVVSHYDLLLAKLLYDNNKNKEIFKWIMSKPNIVLINFKNQTNMIVTNGGIIKSMTRESLSNDIETTFISKIDNEPWHKKYVGKNGYVVSNNPLTNQKPKFYPFSVQIGNVYNEKVQIYAQEAGPYGLKKTILL